MMCFNKVTMDKLTIKLCLRNNKENSLITDFKHFNCILQFFDLLNIFK